LLASVQSHVTGGHGMKPYEFIKVELPSSADCGTVLCRNIAQLKSQKFILKCNEARP